MIDFYDYLEDFYFDDYDLYFDVLDYCDYDWSDYYV